MSSRIWAWIVTSSAVVGSSAMSSSGLVDERHRDHHALAHAARQLVRVGLRPPARHRRCRPARASRWPGPRPRRWRPSCGARTASAIWSPTVKTGLSEVIGSWKIIEIELPRTSVISSSLSFSRSRPSSRISPAMVLPGPLDEPHRRQRGDALAAAGLADDAERLPVLDLEADTRRPRLTIPSWVKKWVSRPLISRRFSAALVRSAGLWRIAEVNSRLAGVDQRVTQAVTEEAGTQHDDDEHDARIQDPLRVGEEVFPEPRSIWPRLISGGAMPKPRKDRAASPMIASATPSDAATTRGAVAPGSMCRTMIRRGRRPERLGGGNEVRLTKAQELRPDQPRGGRPAGDTDGEDDDPDVADPEEGDDEQHEEQVRQRQDRRRRSASARCRPSHRSSRPGNRPASRCRR